MAFELPDLPFAMSALKPYISQETLEYHHDKHHAAYVNKLNDSIKDSPYADMPLEQIMKESDGAIFNNAAQHWNHSFYWNSLSPLGGGEPKDTLKDALTQAFGSVDEFKQQFTQAALGQFGSGWAWLVKDESGKLSIVTTGNAENPITDGLTPLLTCDVWEHAYYIDTRNSRPEYLKNFWEVVNWDFAEANL